MTLTEYADILNKEIGIKYYHNQNDRWSASIHGASIKDGGLLVSTSGNGGTPSAALDDYVKQVQGKTIVFDPGTSYRAEFVVPKSLTRA